jgi:hypothetical protein
VARDADGSEPRNLFRDDTGLTFSGYYKGCTLTEPYYFVLIILSITFRFSFLKAWAATTAYLEGEVHDS